MGKLIVAILLVAVTFQPVRIYGVGTAADAFRDSVANFPSTPVNGGVAPES